VLLAAVLFAAAVLPGLTGKQVAGSPIAESIPGAPTAGQCVLAPPAFPTGTSGGGTLRASVLTYGACDGRHFGEVVKVLQADGSVPAEGPLDYSYSRACGTAAVDYLGLGSLLPGSTHAKDLWWPVLYDGATAGIPDSHQQHGGQHWVACTLIPRATKANPSGFREPIRGRLRSGSAPEGLGLCGDSPIAELNDGGSCDAPHRLQILGEAATTNASSVSELTATCDQLVHAVTRMPDVTARSVTHHRDLSDVERQRRNPHGRGSDRHRRATVGQLRSQGRRTCPTDRIAARCGLQPGAADRLTSCGRRSRARTPSGIFQTFRAGCTVEPCRRSSNGVPTGRRSSWSGWTVPPLPCGQPPMPPDSHAGSPLS